MMFGPIERYVIIILLCCKPGPILCCISTCRSFEASKTPSCNAESFYNCDFHKLYVKRARSAQESSSLISSIRCIFFSSSLIMPNELALLGESATRYEESEGRKNTHINFFLS
jgi:hypothetical protein